jgi:hypothetical protein
MLLNSWRRLFVFTKLQVLRRISLIKNFTLKGAVSLSDSILWGRTGGTFDILGLPAEEAMDNCHTMLNSSRTKCTRILCDYLLFYYC